MNSEKRLRGTPRCGEAAEVGEVVLNFHIPVRVSPRLPGTPPVMCFSPDRRVDERLAALAGAADDDTSTFAVAGTNRLDRLNERRFTEPRMNLSSQASPNLSVGLRLTRGRSAGII
jgi:hypothetical protein